jgi:hypothetical protein
MTNRRDLLKGTAAAAAGIALGIKAGIASASDHPITRENSHAGSIDWQLTRVRPDSAGEVRTSLIEGYCSRQSVSAGESIDIHVSTNPAQDYVIEIFRTGYYGGRGARLMKKVGPLRGKAQPTPEYGEKRLRELGQGNHDRDPR